MRSRPLRSVLVATDLSPSSDTVVRSAAALARQTGARLHLIHAVEPPRWRYDGMDREVLVMQRRIHKARAVLEDQLLRAAPGLAPEPSRTVLYEAPHTAILQRAEEIDADVLVLGPHQGGLEDRLLGTTADRVVRTASVPCLVLPRAIEMPLRRVLVPTDFSAPAREAIHFAMAWGGALGGQQGSIRLRVLHVAKPLIHDPALGDEDLCTPRIEDEIRSVGRSWRGPAETILEPKVVLGDDPAGEIAAESQAFGADLVVLGTHGHGALGRALIGSVSSTVTRLSDRPVLLVPPRLATVEITAPIASLAQVAAT
jgi:nucleotide-binding universal stress UspA family protein